MTKREKSAWMFSSIQADKHSRPNAYLKSEDFYIWDDNTKEEGFYSLRWNRGNNVYEKWIILEYYSKDKGIVYTLFDESAENNTEVAAEETFFNFKNDLDRFNYMLEAFEVDTDEAVAVRKLGGEN